MMPTMRTTTVANTTVRTSTELPARVAVIVERRTELVAGLREAGWDVPDAQGNFVWLPTGEATADVAAAFEEAGLIVRAFPGDGIRISVGEAESLPRVLAVAAAKRP